jgi:hypothetical protein
MNKSPDQTVIQRAIQDLGITVPIYKIVADDVSLTFYLYGGRVLTWHPHEAEGDIPVYPKIPRALTEVPAKAGPTPAEAEEIPAGPRPTLREARLTDVDGIGERTADDLRRRGIISVDDLADVLDAGDLAKYLPKRTLEKAVAWLQSHAYSKGDAA